MDPSPVAIHDLPPLPRDEQGPVFNEPWEAQAFALAVRLLEDGCFSGPEWSAVLSQEIRAAQERCDPGLGSSYYHHWLRALERLCVEKGLVNAADIHRRKEEWLRAYRNTPHGQPVELSASAVEGQASVT
jgi:nitrile hydratase accessory protein